VLVTGRRCMNTTVEMRDISVQAWHILNSS